MNKVLLPLVLFVMLAGKIEAIPAYPHKIPVKVNGQTIFIRLYGDERSKRAETMDGYTIIQNNNNEWCYAHLNQDSALEASSWRLGREHANETEFRSFIHTIPKHLVGKRSEISSPSKVNREMHNVVGERRILIILMEYKDLAFSKTNNDFSRLFNEEGYHDDNALGSVRDFYRDVSYLQLNLQSDIYGPYEATQNMSYYGRNSGSNGDDVNPYALFEEAITNVANEADLSLYDGDCDGFIDNVHIIFAGYGEEAGASANAIWSHESTFYQPYVIQGMKIDRYSCAPELRGNSGNGISRIGPHCHEIGHALGAMDYYDTNYSTGGEFEGTGKWDIMAAGSWNNDGISPADFNPYVKAYNYGWITLHTLPSGEVSIQPSCNNSDNYFILKSSENGDYYLLENRSKTNWGAGIPGKGLLIYHVHTDIENAGNNINASAPQKCYVVCASSKNKKPSNNPTSYGNIDSEGCPYPGSSENHDFGQTSTPVAFYWSGENCAIELNSIILDSNGTVCLINNSTGSSFEPTEMENIFFEGFEGEIKVNICETTGTKWTVVEDTGETMSVVDRPVAFEGKRSLQLSANNNSKSSVSSALEFNCQLNNTSGKLRIKIYLTSIRQHLANPNNIKIGYKTIDNPNWIFLESISSENGRWKQFVIDLPLNALPQFRIEGTTYSGSTLAIDNIEIEQEKPNGTSIRSTQHHSIGYNDNYYYTLDGRRHSSPQHGINIQRMSDGTYRKIWTK